MSKVKQNKIESMLHSCTPVGAPRLFYPCIIFLCQQRFDQTTALGIILIEK